MPPLVLTLGVRRDSMIHNPLMLENTLGARAPSSEGTGEGTAGEPEVDEAVKQEKARLRRVEAVLVAEEAQAELASSQASIQGG